MHPYPLDLTFIPHSMGWVNMQKTPTYEQLEKKVADLERQLEKAKSRLAAEAKKRQAPGGGDGQTDPGKKVKSRPRKSGTPDITGREALQEKIEKEAALNAALAAIFTPLTRTFSAIEDITKTVLEKALDLTGSGHGYVSEIDPQTGNNVCHTLTEMMEGQCQVPVEGDKISFPSNPDGLYSGLWGHSLNTAQPFFTNSPHTHPAIRGLPPGHIPLKNFLSVPVLLENTPVGQIALANKPGGFLQEDLEMTTRLAGIYALAVQRFRMESALVQSERFAKKVIESSLNGIYIYDLIQEKIVFSNKRFSLLTGYTLDSFNGMGTKDYFNLFHPQDKARLETYLENIQNATDEDILEIEYRYKSASGQWLWCFSRAAVFERSPDGTVRQFIGTFQDMTDRKQFEIKLQKQKFDLGERVKELKCLYDIAHLSRDIHLPAEEMLQKIARRIPKALLYPQVTRARITIKAHSPAPAIMNGKNLWTTMPCNHVVHSSKTSPPPASFEDYWVISGAIHVNKNKVGVLDVYYPKQGYSSFLKERKPFIKAIAGLIGSVLEQKQGQKAIEKSNLILEKVLDESPFGIAMYEVETGQCFKANQLMGTIAGGDRAYVLSKNFKTDPDLIAIWKKWGMLEKLKAAIRDNTRQRLEVSGLSTLGNPMNLDCYITPVRVNDFRYILFSVHDISDFKKLQRDLTDAKKGAEIANQAKSEFLASMSHELRTPLNAIIGFSEVLYDQYFGPLNDKQKEYVDHILTSGRHLLSLINDILDLSKIEAGKLKLSLTCQELTPLLEDSLVMIKQKAMKHGIEVNLIVNPEDADLRVQTDARAFKQIMFNLLSNAAKFTPDNGAIEVEAKTYENEVRISVLDTGIGIEKRHQDRIFEEFYQVPVQKGSRAQGTGLGLSLAKKLVEMHDGKIWAKSRGQKFGTMIVFSLQAC